MKIFIQISRIITVFLFSLTISASANSIKLNNDENDIRITQKTSDGFRMEVTLSEFKTMEVKTDKGIFTRIQVPAWSRSRAYGQPEMPVKSELIEIPAGAVVKISLVGWEVNEYRLRDLDISHALMPSQPPVAKSGEIPPFMYEKDVYKAHAFIQSEIVSVEELGTMRGVRIGRLDISPFEYNPGEGEVRIYEKL
ncbi:MAG: C25 family peptidase propeptide domain-containing protein, partial [Bacteroidales bacterium]|nr:C25 family peptidase propeptide domain-containing protein [Bacteroidales bacterium]